MLWLVALPLLILLAWASVRAWQKSSAAHAVTHAQRTAGTMPPSALQRAAVSIETMPDRGSTRIRTSAARRQAAALAALPRLDPDDNDEVEVTMVTASPMSHRPPPAPGERRESLPPEDLPNAPSKIEMIYEDQADIEEITSPVARILVSAEGQSDGGKVRRRNEDSFLVLPERSLYAVADGMGGYAGGDVASALAVNTLCEAFEAGNFEGKTVSLQKVPRRGREMACAIQMANHAVLTRAEGDPSLVHMGTTIVAARFSPNKQRVYIGHVGDSRCYRLRGETLKQLTTDHTLLGLGLKGPGAETLYQAVGIKPKITIDVVVDKPRTEDVYLLCSDGLSKMAKNDEIRDVLLDEPDLEAAVYRLIELANDRGGKDNITVILVKVIERGPGGSP